METFTIGRVAQRLRMNIQTIRYYERQGLIPEPPRQASGYRRYSQEAIARIQFIKRARELRFSLKEISELLTLRADPITTCDDVRTRAEGKITEVAETVKDLQGTLNTLTELVAFCKKRGPTQKCPVLDALDSPLDGGE